MNYFYERPVFCARSKQIKNRWQNVGRGQLFAQCASELCVCTQVEGGAHGEFNWSEVEQSVILSSFFWGYLVFQVPGGRVAEVVGAKRVFGGAVLINGVLSLVLPFLARTHWALLLVTRALQGLAQVRYIQTDTDKTCHLVSITVYVYVSPYYIV